jgi:hypothetical protein
MTLGSGWFARRILIFWRQASVTEGNLADKNNLATSLRDETLERLNLRIWPPAPSCLAGVLLWSVLAWASFYNLTNYPTIWWDEAIFSETAANLVQQGRYAFTIQSPDQLSDLDFRISAGPAVILPVALAYRLLGVGVSSGRLVAGAYLVLTFLALYLGVRRLWGAAAALGAAALALVGTDVLYWGRSVLGDVPALGLFLGGTWILICGLEGHSLWPLFLGGLFLGLAFDAKEFYGLAFLPPLVVLARQSWPDKSFLARRLAAYLAGLALPLVAYLLLKVVILGDLETAVLHFFQQKALLRHEFFTPLTIGRLYPESLGFLLGHPFFWFGLLGAGFLWKMGMSLGEQLWVANFLLWSGVYLTSVYWYRFALPALFLATPLAAQFIRLAVTRLARGPVRTTAWLRTGLTVTCVAALCPLTGFDLMGAICKQQAESPLRLVDFLQKRVPTNCLIETPEYELAFLDDDHRIHLMPSYFFVESTPDRVVLFNPREKPYDFNRVKAELLILGSFGKSVFKTVYPPSQISREWRRIAQVDYYDIYARRDIAWKFIPKKVLAATPKLTLPSPNRPKLATR